MYRHLLDAHHFLCCYSKQAAYEAEVEVQLATEPQGPGVPTSGDIRLAVVYIADTMKGKESNKKKDMSLCRIWKSLLSIPLPLNLVQVSINQR